MSLNATQPMPTRAVNVTYWTSTVLFSLMMGMSAIGYLSGQPMFVTAFQHLGFPSYFRIELGIAKLLGICALLLPVPLRVREWAYAGFGITILSAFIAHSSVDGVATAIPPVVAAALLVVSYFARTQREGKGY